MTGEYKDVAGETGCKNITELISNTAAPLLQPPSLVGGEKHRCRVKDLQKNCCTKIDWLSSTNRLAVRRPTERLQCLKLSPLLTGQRTVHLTRVHLQNC